MALLLRLELLAEALPGGIYIAWYLTSAMAAASFDFYHQTVGFARIFITVDDVLDQRKYRKPYLDYQP